MPSSASPLTVEGVTAGQGALGEQVGPDAAAAQGTAAEATGRRAPLAAVSLRERDHLADRRPRELRALGHPRLAARRAGPVDLRLRYTGSWREQVRRGRSDLEMTGFPVFTYRVPAARPRAIRATSTASRRTSSRSSRSCSSGGSAGTAGCRWSRACSSTGRTSTRTPRSASCRATRFSTRIGGITRNLQPIVEPQLGGLRTGNGGRHEWLSLTGGVALLGGAQSLARQVTIPEGCHRSTPSPADFSNTDTSGAWTPMASVAFKTPPEWLAATGVVDWAMPYFTYARGFIGGGINGAGRSDSPLEASRSSPSSRTPTSAASRPSASATARASTSTGSCSTAGPAGPPARAGLRPRARRGAIRTA